MKKQVIELKQGDIIDPPAGEKTWLWGDGMKRRYTVIGIKNGKLTKKGQYITIFSKVQSPYGDQKMTDINCQMLETKKITVRGCNHDKRR